jgi:hypothetical protein
MKIEGKKKLIKRAVCFARALGVNDFSLTIKVDETEKAGFCHLKEDGSFKIVIPSVTSMYWATRTLAHEMVHLRQFKHDELQYFDNGVIKWKGEKFHPTTYMEDDYYLSPWEVEARGLEDWLMMKWRKRDRELH